MRIHPFIKCVCQPSSLLLGDALAGSGHAQSSERRGRSSTMHLHCAVEHMSANAPILQQRCDVCTKSVSVAHGQSGQRFTAPQAALSWCFGSPSPGSAPPWGLVADPWAAQPQVGPWAAKPPRIKLIKELGVTALCSSVTSLLGVHQLSFTQSWRLHWAIRLPPSGGFQSPAEKKNLERKRGF